MAKQFSIIAVIMIASSIAFGQTTRPKLDQVKNDPKTTENAAKADGQLIDKKNVADSSVLKNIPIKRKEQRSKRRKNLHRRSS